MSVDITQIEPLIDAAHLSERERQVVGLAAVDLATPEIAVELKIKPSTVETYKARARKKLLAVKRVIVGEGFANAHEEAEFILGCVRNLANTAPRTPVFRNVTEEPVFSEKEPHVKLGVVQYSEIATLRSPITNADDVVRAKRGDLHVPVEDDGPYEPGAVANRRKIEKRGEP